MSAELKVNEDTKARVTFGDRNPPAAAEPTESAEKAATYAPKALAIPAFGDLGKAANDVCQWLL